MRQIMVVLVAILVWLVPRPDFRHYDYAQYNRVEPEVSLHELYIPTVEEMLAAAELKYGLPVGILRAIAQVESGMNPSVVGRLGEVGLMQLNPKYHHVCDTVEGQIDVAAAYLSEMVGRFGLELGIAAYNQGPSNPRISRYVRLVKGAWQR